MTLNCFQFPVRSHAETSLDLNNGLQSQIIRSRVSPHCQHENTLNKKAQLSLTNPCDVKACQKLLQFDVLTTLSLTILAYLHSF